LAEQYLLSKTALNALESGKNLLAFSGGVDSSALFFLLLGHKIEFDIAIVDYNIRKESILEVAYAKELATKHNKKIFTKIAPQFANDFEKNARDFRYAFFDEIILEFGYANLITAHQLNDKLEWLLMRLCKGGGINELAGMSEIANRKNYKIVRPLLNVTKNELEEYLKTNNYKYFVDSSNLDTKYERNYFRQNFSDTLLQNYSSGIKKTFAILENERTEYKYTSHKGVYVFLNGIDKIFKENGYLLSGEQRKILEQKKPCVIAGKFAVDFSNDGIGYFAPYENIKMDKKFKEECRILNIPPKIRGFLAKNGIESKSIAAIKTDIC
jgi:tRNA(Ile)-lysidine synthase